MIRVQQGQQIEFYRTLWNVLRGTDLLSSHGSLVHERAYRSLLASGAVVSFLYIDQAKSHSSTPPAAIALQYTVDLKM